MRCSGGQHAIGLVVGPRGNCIDMQKNVDEEIHKESDGVEDQDIRHVCNVVCGQQLHLLFGCAHEQKARRVQKLRGLLARVSTGFGRQRLTKGGRCCQALGSLAPLESFSVKHISMMRAAPAAIKL